MTNALDKTNAAALAPGRLARLARRGVAVCLLACVGIGTAQAQYHGRRDDAQMQPPPSPARGERMPPQIEQPRDRGYDQQREQQQRAYEEQRRQAQQLQQMQQAEGSRDGGRRGGRLTPDERRDLRRQINEAGMDIYPNAQRR